MTWIDTTIDFFGSLFGLWQIKAIFSGITTVMLALFGAWREAYQALLILMVIDLISGVWAAAKAGQFRATTMRQKTVVKFIGYAAVIVAAHQIELVVSNANLDWANEYSLGVALLYLAATEFLSLLENYERISGKRLRPWMIRQALEQLGDRQQPPAKE